MNPNNTKYPAWNPAARSGPNAVLAGITPRASAGPEAGGVDSLRGLTVILAVIFVFLRFSYLHQIQTVAMGFNMRLLYIFGIPVLLAVLLRGGIRNSFRGRPAFYWTAYAAWIALAAPLSSWRGGSLVHLFAYLRLEFVMLFIIAGLVATWWECTALAWAIALAATVNLVSARIFASQSSERLGLDFGSIRNPNDFAAHLLLVLPFLLWVVLSSKSPLLRAGAFLSIGYGLYLILSTGSRGAMVALCADLAFFLLRGTARQRVALLVLIPIAAGLLVTRVPKEALRRGLSLVTESNSQSTEAADSAESRKYLFRKSVQYALENPLFGVGPGMFANYEGGESVAAGVRGNWHQTHNTFTQVASECGIPAMLFFIAGIVSSIRLLNATYREARRRPDCQDITTAVFCLMLGIVGFCAAMTFLSMAYSFYLPAIGGMAIAFAHAARAEFSSRAVAPSNVGTVMAARGAATVRSL
jgi:O-antigen ligase